MNRNLKLQINWSTPPFLFSPVNISYLFRFFLKFILNKRTICSLLTAFPLRSQRFVCNIFP